MSTGSGGGGGGDASRTLTLLTRCASANGRARLVLSRSVELFLLPLLLLLLPAAARGRSRRSREPFGGSTAVDFTSRATGDGDSGIDGDGAGHINDDVVEESDESMRSDFDSVDGVFVSRGLGERVLTVLVGFFCTTSIGAVDAKALLALGVTGVTGKLGAAHAVGICSASPLFAAPALSALVASGAKSLVSRPRS